MVNNLGRKLKRALREAIFRPGIGGVAVAAHFPEAEFIFAAELDRADEFGPFPSFRDRMKRG